jgi:hypothetical protein
MPSTMTDRADRATAATQRNDGPGHGSGGGGLERITVNLIARAVRALQSVSDLTGDTKTDSINRAIQVYAYITEVDAGGGAIYVRESEDSELQRLKIF